MSARQIPVTQFKAQCLRLLDQVSKSGQPLVITKRGKPVARLVPFHTESKSLIGSLVGKIKIKGNFASTGAGWDAER